MKIYYFSGATLPSDSAQSVHVMKMCRALAEDKRGNGVTLFAKSDSDVSEDEVFGYYGVPEVFSLVMSQTPKIPVLRGLLRVLGHRWAVVEYGNPDLAYGRDPIELDWLMPDNIPVVLELHEMPGSIFQQRAVQNLIERKNVRVVVISKSLKADLMKKFRKLPEKKIIVAHDGADPDQTAAARELPGRSDALKVGYTGSLHPGKGMEVLAVLAKEAREFDFHVLGGTKEQVAEWQKKGLGSNIFLHGHIRHGELGAYVSAFDIAIAPYRVKVTAGIGRDIARWMSPMKIFEYMAAGKPIIASDLPVIREVLNDENAILVKPDDVKGWVTALEKLKDESLRQSLAAKARTDLKQHYSWKIRAANILKFVEKGS